MGSEPRVHGRKGLPVEAVQEYHRPHRVRVKQRELEGDGGAHRMAQDDVSMPEAARSEDFVGVVGVV